MNGPTCGVCKPSSYDNINREPRDRYTMRNTVCTVALWNGNVADNMIEVNPSS